jgi:hypothetical protein
MQRSGHLYLGTAAAVGLAAKCVGFGRQAAAAYRGNREAVLSSCAQIRPPTDPHIDRRYAA